MNLKNTFILALILCGNLLSTPLSQLLNEDMICDDGSIVTKIAKIAENENKRFIEIHNPTNNTTITITAPAPKRISIKDIEDTEIPIYDTRNSFHRRNLTQWFAVNPITPQEQRDRDAHCFALRVDQIVQLYGVLVDYGVPGQLENNLILDGKITDHRGRSFGGIFEYAYYYSRGKYILYHRLFNTNPNRFSSARQIIDEAAQDEDALSGMEHYRNLKTQLRNTHR